MSKAREKAVLKAIRACRTAADAISDVLDHLPAAEMDDQRIRMGRELREWAGYMEQATWWRSGRA